MSAGERIVTAIVATTTRPGSMSLVTSNRTSCGASEDGKSQDIVEGSDAEPNCNPLRVQVFDLPERALRNWRPAERAAYEGVHGTLHGLGAPQGVPPSLAQRRPTNSD